MTSYPGVLCAVQITSSEYSEGDAKYVVETEEEGGDEEEKGTDPTHQVAVAVRVGTRQVSLEFRHKRVQDKRHRKGRRCNR